MKHTRINDSLNSVHEKEHFVQFYPEESQLMDNLVRFIGGGIAADDPCIVIANKEHRDELERRLRAHSLDIDQQKTNGNFVLLDSQETLNSFMVNGLPDKALFGQNIGGVLRELSTKNRPIRAFGEMVAILWQDESEASAVILEQLWNEISRQYHLTLFCAYPSHHFQKAAHASMLDSIGKLHSSVLYT